jgi:tetratricopeptide (TPR) repeat protein/transcriptional regulator with XRE-family HTH domain
VPSDVSEVFGAELRRARLQANYSLRQLAAASTYAFGHLSKVEHGQRSPTVDLAERVDGVLGTQLSELVHQQQRLSQAESAPIARPAELPPTGIVVGRETDLQALDRALEQPATPGTPRVLTIDGPPGAGKTALAVYWGHQQREAFPDGQLYVNLRGYDPQLPASPSTVLEELLRKLGVASAVIPAGVDERTALLRTITHGRRLLLVADNARDSEQVLPLLPADASTVVVTSRTRLSGLAARASAQRSALGTLEPAEANTLLQQLIDEARCAGEPRALRTLAVRCDYLPLALHVVGQHVAQQPHRSLADLLAELEGQRLAALEQAGEHLAVSVRSAFSWSYHALAPSTARVFRALGHHPGSQVSLGAAAAAAACPLAQARQELTRLAAAHLVEPIDRDRWQLHDLLRAYAAERSHDEDPAVERDQIVLGLLEWYLHSAAAANDLLAPGRGLPELPPLESTSSPEAFSSYEQALSWCDTEAGNIVFTIDLARQHGYPQRAWLLAVVGFNYYYLSKRRNAWIAAHQRALTAARDHDDPVGIAWCLHNVAAAYSELHQWDQALPALDEAIRLRRDQGDSWGLGWSLFAAGIAASDRGSPDQADHYLREALEQFSAIGFDYGRGAALAQWAVALRKQNRLEHARERGEQALAVFDELGVSDGQSFALLRLGAVHTAAGEPARAVSCFDRALKLREQDHDEWGAAEVELSRGHALLASGASEEARAAWQRAATQFDAAADPRGADARAQLALLDDDVAAASPAGPLTVVSQDVGSSK